MMKPDADYEEFKSWGYFKFCACHKTKLDAIFTSTLGKAILVQSTFSYSLFRPNFDLIVSPVLGPPGGDVWQECVHMLPARRKYLLSFQGEIKKSQSTSSNSYNDNAKMVEESQLDKFIIEHLQQLSRTETTDNFFLNLNAYQQVIIKLTWDHMTGIYVEQTVVEELF
ncbi:hypothetical protein NQ315_012991 [Exocentrus adspersus]|uniref:Exostosin GT47 domain-containing protein n=1 Tax=Exocentrus adspersus TaxID=1586481 RepID=A0AAV8VRW6_9CUCU|nr:hypothetical protein NQ315_012991 [Exocentrus adspersus]